MTDETRTALTRLAREYVRGGECELMDTYSAHEESFLAGAEAQARLVGERMERLERALDDLLNYAEQEYHEGDKGYQFAIIAREALARDGEGT